MKLRGNSKMATDSMYLENLDEFINDENKIVTYKWLSRTLQVHVNQAKQMLYHFVQKERNKKDNDHLSVVYLVAGLMTDGNGTKVHKVEIIPEEKLEVAKSVMKPLTSCHVYSVQKKQLKDTNGLYMADYDLLKEQIFHSNKYSAIKCKSAKLRSKEEIARVAEVSSSSPPRTVKTKPARENGHSTSSTSSKTVHKKDIANMFANASKKKVGNETGQSSEVKSNHKNTEVSKKGKEKAGGVMSFFAKQAEKPKAAKKESPKKQEDVLGTKKEVPPKDESKKPSPKKTSPSPAERKTQRGKKKKSGDSDGEDPIPQQKKRRRIQQKSWESSSEEDEKEEEQEMEIEAYPSPVPSPPPREPTPEPSPAKEAKEEEEDIIPGTPQQTGQKRRKQRRKLVPKTYLDEDGFMVTEKVWETESTDASESEDPIPKPAPTSNKPAAKVGSTDKKEKGGKKKPSPQKKSPGKSKQTSLTNFFKKK